MVSEQSVNSVVSKPAQKAEPAPVMITTLTESSESSSWRQRSTSLRRAMERALRLSGRFRVTTATLSRVSISRR